MSTGERLVRGAIAALALALAALVGGGLVVAHDQRASAAEAEQSWCAHAAHQAAARNETVVGRGIRVAVIGDSYTSGWALAHPGDSWPKYLAKPLRARVHADGFGGSGFTEEAGFCPNVSYLDRLGRVLAGHPDLLVVEGGLNEIDSPPAAVRAAVRTLVSRTRGTRVVVVGPAAAPRLRQGARRVDVELAAVCKELGVQYVSTFGWHLSFLDEGVHLTPAGHREFGRRVAAEIRRS